jgi:exodeoxyribonuclease III
MIGEYASFRRQRAALVSSSNPRRLTNLLDWLREAEPDIVCLQETKAAQAEFPADVVRQAGHHAISRGEKRWNGVPILAKWAPFPTRFELPGDLTDAQSRYIEAAVNGLLVASIYAPNGNPQPGPKFDYKLTWLKTPEGPRGRALREWSPSRWLATTTSCQPSSTSTRPNPGILTPFSSPRAVRHR